MRIATFGVGGVGGYFGGRLAQAGEDVVFIARGEHLKALQQDGLRVDSILGDFRIRPVRATDDPGQAGPVDIVLLAVKAWQVPEAAKQMRSLVGADTGVVFLGNGIEAHEQLSAVLGRDHVLGGMTHISSLMAGPGYIRHVGIKPDVVFGELDGTRSERVERLRQAFERANVDARVPQDILAAIWEKFVFIAAISGVGAVTRAPIGITRKLPETRRLLQAAIEEIEGLARLKEINLAPDISALTMAFCDNLAPGVTASMQRDIMEGRRSELDSQNGAVVRLGQELGIPTPVHHFIYASLLPQELKARREADF
jgi:2-dehydropantoate 2-reductase